MQREPLSVEAVAHVARLARLELSKERIDAYRTQLAGVLEHVAKVNAIAVDGVEPMAYPFETSNRLAEDEIAPPMPLDDLLMNAPATEGRFLAVPRVLAEGD
ncbi:MAG: Asp-tRNA(Asn)/Glu-tRNA(Gln) amidotransferase subunit GatC [Phycisphaeraceae bacterium]|nr:Asp-tRNA(Asn)/Glu-tRNA(Gln) amidotransferase subunit GatC [Phycisphaeraceae bacterium]